MNFLLQAALDFGPRGVQLISGDFVPMNEMFECAGMSERQIFDRTKAVFEYFNLPFDVDLPCTSPSNPSSPKPHNTPASP